MATARSKENCVVVWNVKNERKRKTLSMGQKATGLPWAMFDATKGNLALLLTVKLHSSFLTSVKLSFPVYNTDITSVLISKYS